VGCSAPTDDEETDDVTEAVTGPTCGPKRAAGAVNRFQKALHNSIAFAEGTKGHGKDGYNIAFSYRKFGSCSRHPDLHICSGALCSTAAGRYQFLKGTWDRVAPAIKAKSFEPEFQEKGTRYLITKVRKVAVPPKRALTATEFSNAMKKLSYEWASLPPGRYGQ